MEETHKELKIQFLQYQERYVYYLLALTVSAIGFSIYRTTGVVLKLTQIPLGIAILSWGFSIYCGLTFIKYVLSNIYSSISFIDVQMGRYPDIGNVTWKQQAAYDGINQAILSNSEKSSLYFKWQGRLFYFGIFAFIIWHIIEMYYQSNII